MRATIATLLEPLHRWLLLYLWRCGLLLRAGDILQEWGSSAAYTITLTGLATSSSKVAGRQSTTISHTTADPLDYLVGGKITTGTSPTVSKTIDVWVFGSVDDTPTYPDSFGSSDAARSATSENVRNSALKLLASMVIDSTSDRSYWFGPTGIAQLFGGGLPKNHGVWVVHDTAVNLNATASNHAISYTPIYARYT